MSSLYESVTQLWYEYADKDLKAYRSEALELRNKTGGAINDRSFAVLHTAFTTASQSLDRMETIVSQLGFLRSQLRTLLYEVENEYDDKWREAVDTTRTGEYMSGKAQDATYAGKAFNELVKVRKVKKYSMQAEETYEYVHFLYRGLERSKRDIETAIRLLSNESYRT